jgi:dephospho-CoA kinase
MITVGLTGGIGSGKSTVSKIFETLGIPVFESDKEGRLLLKTDRVVSQIVQEFSQDVLNETGVVDRKKLADIVFGNPKQLMKLNRIIHPAIHERFEYWKGKMSNYKYVIIEAAILFESGLYRQVDYTLTVSAPLDLRIKRVILRDGVGEDAVLARISNQLTDKERETLSRWVICNDGICAVMPQVQCINNELMRF